MASKKLPESTQNLTYKIVQPGFKETVKTIDAACKEQQTLLKKRLAAIAQSGKDFKTSVAALERALNDLSQSLTPLIFMKYVSEDPKLREAADRCETAVDQMRIDIFGQEDLFLALKKAKASKEKLSPEDTKLMDEYLLSFKRNGLELSAAKRKEFLKKKKRIVQLESAFGKELIEWKDWCEFTKEELEGLPASFVERLEKTPKGKFKVTVKYPDYYPFMENAKNIEARRKLEEKFYNRGGAKNKARFAETLKLRHEAAKMLGYSSHAAFVLDDRMAKTPKAVSAFLDRITQRLVKRGKQDLKELLAAKKADLGEKNAKTFLSHDWRYYDNQIKKQKHQIDMQVIKEYFPLDVVNRGMFEIYETLLGVKFVEDKSIPSWHPSATPYRVVRDGKTVAIFFMDLFPREGKYGHAAAFTLIQGNLNDDGSYQLPMSSIVANFNPPTKDTPSLLEHGEVKTLFHEFGHIMHQVLTTAKWASFAGTSVKRDFVEAPSQMLENWVWETETLPKLSGHYKDPSKKLPKDQIDRLVKAKDLHVGVRYLRQLLFALLDQRYHTKPTADTTKVYADLSREIMMIPIPPKTLPEAGFGHLMGGYDSGYYGYLWSEVFAADMFTRFEKEGLLSSKVGADYLNWILRPGGTLEPMELIENFLGRKPNEEAFFKSIGLAEEKELGRGRKPGQELGTSR